MRTRLFTIAAVAALAAFVPAAHATTVYVRVVVPDRAVAGFGGGAGAQGLTCGLAVTSDPTAIPPAEIGVMTGGPALFSPAGADVVVCSVHVNNGTHAGVVAVSAAAASGTGVVVLPPTLVTYVAAVTDTVYVCTEWHHNGVVRYYDDVLKIFVPLATAPCVLA